MLDLNAIHLTVPLDPNDLPSQVAAKLAVAMTAAGFVITLDGDKVNLDWEHPANLALLGSNVHTEMGIENSADGPTFAIKLPKSANAVPTLSQWGLIIFGIILLAVGVAFIIRRKRLMNV